MDNDSAKVISTITMKELFYKVDSLYDAYAKSRGLNYTSILVLELLCEPAVNYTQKEICDKLGLPKQLVNSIIKSFWEQGYVELKEAKDRRNKHLILTDKGKEYALLVLKPLEDAESAAWDSFSVEEIRILTGITEKFLEVFNDTLKKLPAEQQ